MTFSVVDKAKLPLKLRTSGEVYVCPIFLFIVDIAMTPVKYLPSDESSLERQAVEKRDQSRQPPGSANRRLLQTSQVNWCTAVKLPGGQEE